MKRKKIINFEVAEGRMHNHSYLKLDDDFYYIENLEVEGRRICTNCYFGWNVSAEITKVPKYLYPLIEPTNDFYKLETVKTGIKNLEGE